MFGPVPDDFYALVGRIGLVATLVEDRVLGLLWSLDDKPQPTYGGRSAAELYPLIEERVELHAGELGADLIASISEATTATADALEERHALLHSLWPNPTMEKAQGWRSKRIPKSAGGGSEIVWTETDAAKLQACLDELVRLADVILVVTNRVWGVRSTH